MVLERFPIDRLAALSCFDKTTESLQTCQTIGFVRGLEFHDRLVLGFNAEAGDALTAVDVKHPHRRSPNARNAGKKITERFGSVIVFDNEAPFFSQKVFWTFCEIGRA